MTTLTERLAGKMAEYRGDTRPHVLESFKHHAEAIAPDVQELLDAIKETRGLIAEAALTGFICTDGNWAERLFATQGTTHAILSKWEGK